MTGLGKRFYCGGGCAKKWLIVPQPIVQTLLGFTPADFVRHLQWQWEFNSEAPALSVVLLIR